MATGDLDGGRAAFEEAVAATPAPDAVSTYATGQLALLDVLEGRWARAAELSTTATRLIEEAGLEDLLSSGAAFVAAAVIAARAHRVGEARQHLRAVGALEHGLSIAIPFDAFEIHTFAAEAQLLLGDVVAARSHARAAAEYLDALGDGGVFEARLDAVFAEIEAQPVDSQAVPVEGSDALTARERQVLGLLQTDLSLRGIGHELYISRDTAKMHAGRIYRKLGVSSRAGAVARARELDLI